MVRVLFWLHFEHWVTSLFVSLYPDVGQTNHGVKAEENSQRKSQIQNDVPSQVPVECSHDLELPCLFELKGIDEPHGQVAEQKEGDERAARLFELLFQSGRFSPETVNDKDHLEGGLSENYKSVNYEQDVHLVLVWIPAESVESGDLFGSGEKIKACQTNNDQILVYRIFSITSEWQFSDLVERKDSSHKSDYMHCKIPTHIQIVVHFFVFAEHEGQCHCEHGGEDDQSGHDSTRRLVTLVVLVLLHTLPFLTVGVHQGSDVDHQLVENSSCDQGELDDERVEVRTHRLEQGEPDRFALHRWREKQAQDPQTTGNEAYDTNRWTDSKPGRKRQSQIRKQSGRNTMRTTCLSLVDAVMRGRCGAVVRLVPVAPVAVPRARVESFVRLDNDGADPHDEIGSDEVHEPEPHRTVLEVDDQLKEYAWCTNELQILSLFFFIGMLWALCVLFSRGVLWTLMILEREQNAATRCFVRTVLLFCTPKSKDRGKSLACGVWCQTRGSLHLVVFEEEVCLDHDKDESAAALHEVERSVAVVSTRRLEVLRDAKRVQQHRSQREACSQVKPQLQCVPAIFGSSLSLVWGNFHAAGEHSSWFVNLSAYQWLRVGERSWRRGRRAEPGPAPAPAPNSPSAIQCSVRIEMTGTLDLCSQLFKSNKDKTIVSTFVPIRAPTLHDVPGCCQQQEASNGWTAVWAASLFRCSFHSVASWYLVRWWHIRKDLRCLHQSWASLSTDAVWTRRRWETRPRPQQGKCRKSENWSEVAACNASRHRWTTLLKAASDTCFLPRDSSCWRLLFLLAEGTISGTRCRAPRWSSGTPPTRTSRRWRCVEIANTQTRNKEDEAELQHESWCQVINLQGWVRQFHLFLVFVAVLGRHVWFTGTSEINLHTNFFLGRVDVDHRSKLLLSLIAYFILSVLLVRLQSPWTAFFASQYTV